MITTLIFVAATAVLCLIIGIVVGSSMAAERDLDLVPQLQESKVGAQRLRAGMSSGMSVTSSTPPAPTFNLGTATASSKFPGD